MSPYRNQVVEPRTLDEIESVRKERLEVAERYALITPCIIQALDFRIQLRRERIARLSETLARCPDLLLSGPLVFGPLPWTSNCESNLEWLRIQGFRS